jgi:hypothetical protein
VEPAATHQEAEPAAADNILIAGPEASLNHHQTWSLQQAFLVPFLASSDEQINFPRRQKSCPVPRNEGSMPICIECRHPVKTLWREGGGDKSGGHNIRLTVCKNCGRFCDKYVEHDFVVLFIDLVLIKPQVRCLCARAPSPRCRAGNLGWEWVRRGGLSR